MFRPWMKISVLLVFVALCGGSMPAEDAPPLLTAAGAPSHAWFVAQGKDGTYSLFHHFTPRQPPSTTSLIDLTSRPLAMTAWDSRLWLIFDGGCTDDVCRYKICTTRIRVDPEFNQDQLNPAGRLDVEPTLEQKNPLAGCVATDDGLVVLFMPGPWAGREVRDEESGELRSGEPDPPALKHLRQGSWSDLPLPDELSAGDQALLLPPGPDGRSIRLLVQANRRSDSARQFVLDPDDSSWSEAQPVELELNDVEAVVRIAYMPVLVLQRDADQPGMLELAYIRTDGLLSIGLFQRPQQAWGITGQDDGARLVGQRTNSTFWVTRIDALSGEIAEEQTLGPPRMPLSGFFHRIMLLLAMVGSVVIVFTMKPGSREPTPLPDDVQPMALSARSLSLLVDLLPSGLITMLVLSVKPTELLVLPITAMDFTDSVPFLLMAGITLLHQGIGEAIWKTSLGKWLFGGRIRVLDESTGIWRVVLIRTGIKAMTYLIPPIVLLVITNHNLQGIGDILARSVVVTDRAEVPSEE